MTALRMEPTAIIAGRAGQPRDLVAVEHAGRLADRLIIPAAPLHLGKQARRVGALDIACLHALAIDVVAADEIEDEIGGIGLSLDEPGSKRLSKDLTDR